MNIRFAFAVNSDNKFTNEHFGDADKFIFYETAGDKIYFVQTEPNLLKNHIEENSHGDPQKGKRIIKYLINRKIDVIVAKQFGKNIAMVKDHFLPIIISGEEPLEIKSLLSSRLELIEESFKNKKNSFSPVNGRDWE
ncbi:MAG: hypothetical protein K9H49_11935 [Bacteroidales bacterium]|nr:hypothetical protein [Bacteroidales bacterium]MCF8390807.1 hypothetical protein [Bacteroidales bacterium]